MNIFSCVNHSFIFQQQHHQVKYQLCLSWAHCVLTKIIKHITNADRKYSGTVWWEKVEFPSCCDWLIIWLSNDASGADIQTAKFCFVLRFGLKRHLHCLVYHKDTVNLYIYESVFPDRRTDQHRIMITWAPLPLVQPLCSSPWHKMATQLKTMYRSSFSSPTWCHGMMTWWRRNSGEDWRYQQVLQCVL